MSDSRLKELLRNLSDFLKPQIAHFKSNKTIQDLTKTLQIQVTRFKSNKTVRELIITLEPQISYLQSEEGARTLSWALPVIIASLLQIAAFFGGLRLFSGDLGSARFILGTIAGVLAALLALLLTVPLIALQMVVSRYGSRIYENIVDREVVILLLVFILSLLYPIAGLSVLHLSDPSKIVSTGIIYASMSVFLTVPYIWRIKDKLKPETLIDSYANSAISAIKMEDSRSAEEKVDAILELANRAIGETDRSVFSYCVIKLFEVWKSRPRLAVHNILELKFAGLLQMACTYNEMVARHGVDTLINIISDASESRDRETWGGAMNLIESVCSAIQPNTSTGLRLHWVETIGGFGKLVASADPDLSLRIIDALAGPLGIENTTTYTASRSIRWIGWIFESLVSLEAFRHIVDLFDQLLNDPSEDIDPELRGTIVGEMYRLCQLAAFRIRGPDRVGMLNHLVPKLPPTPNQSLLILLPLIGANTITEKEELKDLQPKVLTKLWEFAGSSRIEEQLYLKDLFEEARSAARRMNLDLPIGEFEQIATREKVETETLPSERERSIL